MRLERVRACKYDESGLSTEKGASTAHQSVLWLGDQHAAKGPCTFILRWDPA